MKLRPLAGILLCLGIVVTAAPVAAAGTPPQTTDRADAAAGWLARQLVDGERFEVEFEGQKFPDQGLTIDAVFAFASAGVSDRFGANAARWLARPEILSGYVGDGVTESYAGATAKLTLAAQVRGLDPTSFGGVNLPARLRALITASGRISDRSQFGDFSNAFSQSLGIIALRRTPGGAPRSVIDFAVGTQCADGGFPIALSAPTCASDTDATALVVQALLATGRYADAREGLVWLAGKQQPNGGLASGPGTGTPNSNTTGLAGQAFKAGGVLRAASRARGFIVSLQVCCDGAVADRGAIAFDQGGVNPATVVRATAQAILGLGGASFGSLTAAGSKPEAPVLNCP